MSVMMWDSALEQIQRDVKQVEARLELHVQSPIALVDAATQLTLSAGGKRLRPAFVVLSGQAVGGALTDRLMDLAACMEMLHMATLIHDDVIDDAKKRRGMPTAASKFGNLAAILSGDVLLAKSMSLLAQDGDLTIIRAVSAMVVEMVEGEAREVEVRCDSQLSLEDHLQILRMKTAAFVECCCFVGATAAGANPATAQALGKYGHHLGMAFQVVDDLLDLVGDPQTTGKPRGTDFKEGCMTMPLILLRQKPEIWQQWEPKFGGACSEADLEALSTTLMDHGFVADTKAFAQAECDLAMAALQEIPNSSARALLGAVVEFVQQRQS